MPKNATALPDALRDRRVRLTGADAADPIPDGWHTVTQDIPDGRFTVEERGIPVERSRIAEIASS